jgi:hypothetical protein
MIEKFSSFDGNLHVNTNKIYYDNSNTTIIIKKPIPRGAGLSPRLISAFENLDSISITNKLNNINYNFNLLKSTVTVDANSTFAELNKSAFHFGLEIPVIGYSSIQIGAGIASCIHGKNHFKYDFGHLILSIKILLFSNEIIDCSKQYNKEIFELTIGGYGSTGLILSAEIQLAKIVSTTILRERINIKNLNDSNLEYLPSKLNNCCGSFGWHNLHTNNNINFGKGFIYKDSYHNNDLYMPDIYPVKPAHLYQPSSIYKIGQYIFGSFFNQIYEFKEMKNKKFKKINVFSEAIASKNIYWSIMRSSGFIEVQYIIPYENFYEFNLFLNKLINKTKATTSVCITKPASGKKEYFRFRSEGINIDITGITNYVNINFFNELNKSIVKFNGIPNFSKCSILTENILKECYKSEYDRFFEDYQKFLYSKPPIWFLKRGLIQF